LRKRGKKKKEGIRQEALEEKPLPAKKRSFFRDWKGKNGSTTRTFTGGDFDFRNSRLVPEKKKHYQRPQIKGRASGSRLKKVH